jgi:glycosyltransferase involved in cell wall biosynthesis
MIVIVQSLDASLQGEKLKGSFKDMKRRYEAFSDFGSVYLLTQDTEEFTHDFSKLVHVPCNFTTHEMVKKAFFSSVYLKWFFFFVKSFSWLVAHRRSIALLVGENIDSPAPLIVSILFRIPYVVYYHYDVGSQLRWANRRSLLGIIILCEERFAFNRIENVWVTSPHLASVLKANGRKKRIVLIPNWVDVDEIENTGRISLREVGISSAEVRRVLFVGRLHRVKRVDLLVQAFFLVQKEKSNATLSILGDGEERTRIAELINSLGLHDRVDLMGFVDRSTVFDTMRQSDVLVLCSEVEGNPRVLIEAMLNRTPIVAVDIPGVRDMVHHLETGYLVRNSTSEGLANAILYVLDNKDLSKKMADNAYIFAVNTFGRRNVEKKIREELICLTRQKRVLENPERPR